jgi:hypothetical protein
MFIMAMVRHFAVPSFGTNARYTVFKSPVTYDEKWGSAVRC